MCTFKFLFLILVISDSDRFGKSSQEISNSTRASAAWQVKLFGGVKAKIGDYPYVVAIIRNFSYRCTGSIIEEDWILTAAHCLNKKTQKLPQFSVAVGEVVFSKKMPVYLVKDHYIHPQYNHSFLYLPIENSDGVQSFTKQRAKRTNKQVFLNDIALLKLKDKLTWSFSVAPIRLGSINDEDPLDVVVMGFGREFRNDRRSIRRLNYLTLRTVRFRECAARYHWMMLMEQKTQICAFKGVLETPYKGDSGGPLVDPKSGKQVGVTSFGINVSYPVGFTRLSHFVPWIKNVTGLTLE